MNKIRRKNLEKIYEELAEIRDLVDVIKDEEERAKDNLPESLEGSDRYFAMEEAVENLDYAMCSIDEAMIYIERVKE